MSYLRTVCIEVKIFMKLREYCFLFGQSRCYCTEKLKHCNNTTLVVGNQEEFLEKYIRTDFNESKTGFETCSCAE